MSAKKTAVIDENKRLYNMVPMQAVIDYLQQQGEPAYRLDQFNRHFYQQLVTSFAEITTFSKGLRQELEEKFDFSSLETETVIESPQGNTLKAVSSLKRESQLKVETVLMRHTDGRRTVCVSSMVGCPVGCSFCATGQMGFKTNLTAREMIDQILFFARWLNEKDEKISNIVFMGMGEPLLNLKAVEKAVDIIIDPDKLAMSQRRLTISTAGYPAQIKQLVADGYDQLKLAISLHAPNQELREKIMPVASVHPLDELMAACDYYVNKTNKLVTYEYILIAKINDQPIEAEELVQLLQNRLAHVNLIPYNPIDQASFTTPNPKQVKKFSQILSKAGVSNSIRVTMGAEIDAACGQLANQS